MIVWNDAQRRTMETPAWLAGAEGLTRVQTTEGDLLAMGRDAVSILSWRPDAAWVDVGDGWKAAVYGESPEPWRNERPLPWAVPLLIEDGAGIEWRIPAILSPLGTICMDTRSRLTEAGWIEEPVNPIAKRGHDACVTALPFARDDRLHEMHLDRQNEAIAAILECCYFFNALTIARLGLITGTLRRHGIRAACGVVHVEASARG